jgi:multidrug efflux system membrane fusion protein
MKHVPAIRMARSFGFIVAAVVLSGCGGSEHAGKAELPPPQVTVAPPTERTVTRYEFATGRCQPLEQVEVRARVNGYLRSVYFKQGKEIEKGTLMAEIDTDTYDADLARTKASLKTAEADEGAAAADLSRAMSRTDTTKKEYDRQDTAFKRGAASSKEFDKAKGDYDEAVSTQKSTAAKVKQAKAKIDEAAAAVRTADLNLGYCKIKAPISGLVGDRLITEGNLITGGMGNANLITTIVAVEKMDIGFDVSENTIQRIHKAMNDGKLKKTRPANVTG